MKLSNSGEVSQVKFDDTLTKAFKGTRNNKKEIKTSDIKKNDYANC